MAQWAKNPPTMQETQDTRVRFLDQEVPPENLATWQPALYSRLKNPMDRVAWRAVVPGVTKSWTLVSKRTHTHTQSLTFSWVKYMYHLLLLFTC